MRREGRMNAFRLSRQAYRKPPPRVEGFQEGGTVPTEQYEWLRWMDGTGDDVIQSVVSDNEGNAYIVGSAPGTLSEFKNLDGTSVVFGSAQFPTKPSDEHNIFLAKVNPVGQLQWLSWLEDDQGGLPANSYCKVHSIGDNIYIQLYI